MDLSRFERHGEYEWHIVPHGAMRVPGVIFASEELVRDMDDKVYEQVVNVATLPGIVKASYAMPDAHWGYGFPIGGVAAFDPARGGIISAGGVGFDISCGVRLLHGAPRRRASRPARDDVADTLFVNVPAGVGSTGHSLNDREMAAMLTAAHLPVKRQDTAVATISSTWRSTAASLAPTWEWCPRAPRTGNATRWGRSARATTTWKSSA
jgi:tRNA-splicing ligase RtcB